MSSLDNFRAVAPVVLTVVGLLCGMLGVMARLYHNKALAKKDIELQTKDLELEGKNAELARAIAMRAHAPRRPYSKCASSRFGPWWANAG
jgi:uncharacterized membrane-anchored protein YhcB (DUF1043 family)